MSQPATLTGACIISVLNLLSPELNDIATLDCELHKLEILSTKDAAEWDPYATACISPESLTTSSACAKVPLFTLGDTPVYELYNAEKATKFFELQTQLDTEHCHSWFFGKDKDQHHEGNTCGCEDRIALKTLGSHRRNSVLMMHKARVEAAESVRSRRKLAVDVLRRAVALRCKDANINCDSVRAVYAGAVDNAAHSDYIPGGVLEQ